ncbi:MAG: zinc-ribbon domain-containing protein [Betaproteobacteria bacterium]|nr:zinc-ribbon domain-containing protein [Betaproteobacteria bacterium]MBI2961200.1 zinc-ribbon domain-containing protein [Betaproteobacteria bacterium]
MLITRCSHCLTAFRVTQAQIEARQGKVRCGHCQAVFDALDSLRDKAEDARGAAEPLPHHPPAAKAPPAAAKSDTLASPAAAAAPKSQSPAPKARAMAQPTTEPVPEPDGEPRVAARGRGLGWLAAALLGLALVGQVAFHNRGEVALLVPQLEPSMKALCEALGCELPLPRRVELMSIESSDLRADSVNPAVMVLTATLRNRAAFPQSLPALELTLTDARDQALARRVLSAPEYLGRGAAERFAANSELAVKVFIEAASLGAAGYRLYLFFP